GFQRAPTTIWLYRIPSLIGAIGAVLLTYWTALAFVSRRAAVLTGLMMATCVLLDFERLLAKTDAMLLLTTVAAMGAMARAYLAGLGLTGRGLTGPGLTGPGLTGPGLTGPGLTGPGLTGPGLTGLGLTGPGERLAPTQGWTIAAVFWTALAAGVLLKGPLIVMVVGLAIAALAAVDRTLRWLWALQPLPRVP